MRKIILEKIDSTNTYLKALAEKGEPEGTLVIAREQTAGRGRSGKSFFSPDKTGLYMSFLIRPDLKIKDALNITSLTAVALSRAIEELTGKSCDIKWVNDLYYKEKKVAGILVEAKSDFERDLIEYAIIGIGVNLKAPDNDFPSELSRIAGALDTSVSPEPLAEKTVEEFFNIYKKLPEKSFYDEYKKRSFLIGKEIYTLGESSVSGKAVDVDEDFGLVIETASGEKIVLSSGEVSVRVNK